MGRYCAGDGLHQRNKSGRSHLCLPLVAHILRERPIAGRGLVCREHASAFISNAAERVAHFILVINIGDNRFGICENVFFKIIFKLVHLMYIKLWLCSGMMIIQQRMETVLLITFEIVTGYLLVKKKNLRYLNRRPSFG